MVYVDTSVLVALLVQEACSDAVDRWYRRTKDDLVSAAWCVTEFASALGLKQRSGQIEAGMAASAWDRFERLLANDVRLLPVDAMDFQQAALLTLEAHSGLRAGDALHLACARRVGARSMATLDDLLGRNAQRLKIKRVALPA